MNLLSNILKWLGFAPKKKTAKEKGDEFEQLVVNKFDKQYFILKEWRTEICMIFNVNPRIIKLSPKIPIRNNIRKVLVPFAKNLISKIICNKRNILPKTIAP